MTDAITDSGLTSGNGASPYLARWTYLLHQIGGIFEYERVSNINPQAVVEFQSHYDDQEIADDDLFYYTYGILHSPQYRQAFAADLSKTTARIPMAPTHADFRAFVIAGRELADLHLHYETVNPYPLTETYGPGYDPNDPKSFRVEKMVYGGRATNPNKSQIVCNAHITLSGIPEQAHEYRLGSRSALDWLIDRYMVRTDKQSGITNDPNDWATEHGDPRYIIDLVKRVTAVSLRTVEIVRNLPYLHFDDEAESQNG